MMSSTNKITNMPLGLSSGNIKTYNCNNYSDVFEKIQFFYGEQQHCDVTLTDARGETQVRAHRLILSVCSEYFSTMFNGSFKEATSKEVKLEDIDGKTLQMVIRFMYSNTIDIEGDTVENIMKAAHLLQIKPLEVVCCDYLRNRVEACNVLGVLMLADRYNITALYKYAFEFALEHFMELPHDEEFFLIDVHQLSNLIASDNVRVSSEEDVFHSMLAWVQHDGEQREQFFEELFQHLRLTLLSPKFISSTVEPAIRSSKCKELVSNAYKWHLLPELRQPLVPKPQILRRSLNDLVVIDGWKNEDHNLRVALYSNVLKKWSYRECPQPLVKRVKFGFTSLNGKLYISGGDLSHGDGTNSVNCLDLKTFQWTSLPPSLTVRFNCGMTTLNGVLYIVGDAYYRHSSVEYLDCVEKWDPLAAWKYIAPRDSFYNPVVGVKGSLLCIARDKDDDGDDGDDGEKILDIYDPVTKEWTYEWSRAPKDLLGMGTVSINRVDHFVTVSKMEIKVYNLENKYTKIIPVHGAENFVLFNNCIIIKNRRVFRKYCLVVNEWECLPDPEGITSKCVLFSM